MNSNKCPVVVADANKQVHVDYADATKSTQLYNIVLADGQQPCTFNGTYYGSTFSEYPRSSSVLQLLIQCAQLVVTSRTS